MSAVLAAWRFATSSSRARAVESSPVAGPRPQGSVGPAGQSFEPAVIDRVDVDIRVEYRNDVAEIISASLPDERVRPGETLPVRVVLRPYADKEFVEVVPVWFRARWQARHQDRRSLRRAWCGPMCPSPRACAA